MLPSFSYEYVSYEELYRAYLDCRKRKRHTTNSAEFEVNLHENLYRLWIELNRKEYKIGKSIVFIVDHPVKREVFAASFRDRIIHHLIINRMMPFYESEVIENSFSCRVGKGTLCAAKTLEKQAIELSNNYTEDIYVLKCDLKSFFMSIDKELLYRKICELIRNKVHKNDEKQADYLCYLTRLVIMDEPQNKCKFKQSKRKWIGLPKDKSLFTVSYGHGIPIGNLNSQIFANYFLDDFDKYVIYTLGFLYYGRYVDDFYILDKNKERLLSAIPLMRDKLSETGIRLHPKKIYIQKIEKGIKFVGSVIKPHRTYISNRTKGNMYTFLHKSYEYIMGNKPSIEDVQYFVAGMNSYLGYMKHHDTYNIRKKVLKSKEMKLWYDYCYPDESFQKLIPYKEYNPYNKGLSKNYAIINRFKPSIDEFPFITA